MARSEWDHLGDGDHDVGLEISRRGRLRQIWSDFDLPRPPGRLPGGPRRARALGGISAMSEFLTGLKNIF
jgi:hypothetical protein